MDNNEIEFGEGFTDLHIEENIISIDNKGIISSRSSF